VIVCQVLALGQLTVPEMGVVRVTWPSLEFYIPWNIFGTATVVKILCACRLFQMLAFGRLIIPGRGMARVTWCISEFYTA